MDYQEAIEALRLEGGIEITGNPRRAAEFFDGIDVAISAMEELMEYKQIGTLEEVRDAVERQTAKKPKGDLHSVPHYRCPNCNNTVKLYQNSGKDEICKWCGQVIDWSEEDANGER